MLVLAPRRRSVLLLSASPSPPLRRSEPPAAPHAVPHAAALPLCFAGEDALPAQGFFGAAGASPGEARGGRAAEEPADDDSISTLGSGCRSSADSPFSEEPPKVGGGPCRREPPAVGAEPARLCPFCPRLLLGNGGAHLAHYRAHAGRGECVECADGAFETLAGERVTGCGPRGAVCGQKRLAPKRRAPKRPA